MRGKRRTRLRERLFPDAQHWCVSEANSDCRSPHDCYTCLLCMRALLTRSHDCQPTCGKLPCYRKEQCCHYRHRLLFWLVAPAINRCWTTMRIMRCGLPYAAGDSKCPARVRAGRSSRATSCNRSSGTDSSVPNIRLAFPGAGKKPLTLPFARSDRPAAWPFPEGTRSTCSRSASRSLPDGGSQRRALACSWCPLTTGPAGKRPEIPGRPGRRNAHAV